MAWGQYCLCLLLLMSAAVLLAGVSHAQMKGVERPIKWAPVEDFSDPQIHELAEFAVTEYSKKTSQHLVFHSIVSAEDEDMGTWTAAHYRFVIAVENRSMGSWTLEKYVAIVWGGYGPHALDSFKPVDV